MNQEMTLRHVIEVYYLLKGIIDDNQYHVDPLCKFKLLGLMKCLQSYVHDFDVVKNELIIKYGKESENGNFTIDRDDTEAVRKVNEELEPLLNSKVTADISPLKPEDIFNKGIPSEYLTVLYEFIDESGRR